MSLIKQEVFVCLDCESTGLDPANDRMIELAAMRFTLEQDLNFFESLVDPECEIPQSSQEIHKISKDMLFGQPKALEVLPKFLKMIEGHTLVGHGIGFDIALIAAEAKRAQIPCKIESQPFIDTLRLARLYGESPINSLSKLREHFNIAPETAHRAMSDVRINIAVFKQLVKPYPSTNALFKALEKPIRLKTMPLGKHKGRPFDEIPIEYLLWAERKNFDQDLLFSIRSELKNRKKGNRFEQNASPFADL